MIEEKKTYVINSIGKDICEAMSDDFFETPDCFKEYV